MLFSSLHHDDGEKNDIVHEGSDNGQGQIRVIFTRQGQNAIHYAIYYGHRG